MIRKGGNWLYYGEDKRTTSTDSYGNNEYRRSFGTKIASQCNKATSTRIYSTNPKIVNECKEDQLSQQRDIASLEKEKEALLKENETLIYLGIWYHLPENS